MKKFAAAVVLALPLLAVANDHIQIGPDPKVTVMSQGHDVRLVLTNIFSQAKKSVIIQTGIQYNLFLNLQDTDFSRALDVICSQAGLTYEIRDGIYHVHRKKAVPSVPVQQPIAVKEAKAPVISSPEKTTFAPATTDPIPDGFVARPSQLPEGRLPVSVLKRKISTRLTKTTIQEVLDTFGSQAKVKFELDPTVPAYRLDIFLRDTSLKYALDQVAHAAKLKYAFTDHQSIRLSLKDDKNGLLP
ncbi:MAG TPA: hypothetical protein VG944_08855 [Fimbriimonas sp.]|nr:hypothetical protein [Fimbriimonas sp.]